MDSDGIRTFVKEQIAYLKDHQVEAAEVGDQQPLFDNGDEPAPGVWKMAYGRAS